MTSINSRFLFLLLSAGLLIWSAFLISDLDYIQENAERPVSNQPIGRNATITKAKSLINNTNGAETIFFAGSADNPFRNSLLPKRTPGTSHIVRKKLVLKGLLFKDKPVAILETESGETFIRGVGESVDSQVVIHIDAAGVKLRDRKGEFVLKVEDKN